VFLCEDAVERGLLVRVLPDHAQKGAPLHVVYPSARHLPLRVGAFRDALVEALGGGEGGVGEAGRIE
jgi:DNA-binding transcriptional LysR family regulator